MGLKRKSGENVGKINLIACRNFVTYQELVLYPGNYLNLVIGPNGTGKSTIVAAIIIGMGGSPKILSRSANLKDYIKNGENSAWINIKLYKNNKNELISFERYIEHGKKLLWKVDGETVNEKTYLQTVSFYNIQIENLCQFLPQDRVQDFAKLNPQELLHNTQLSVGEKSMMENFMELKHLRQIEITGKKTLNKNQIQLKNAEQRNLEISDAVEQLKLRNELIEKKERYQIHKLWLEYNELQQKYSNSINDLDNAKESLNCVMNNLRKMEKREKKIFSQVNNWKKNRQNMEEIKSKWTKNLESTNRKIVQIEKSVKDAKNELNYKKKFEIDRIRELEYANSILKALLQDYENAIQECGPENQRKELLNKLEQEMETKRKTITKLMDDYNSINRELDTTFQPELIYLQRNLNACKSISDRSLKLLEQRFYEVYKAVIWLRGNQNLFESKIFEPMLIEVKMKDSNHAKYIENTVSLRDLLAFTCVNKRDFEILTKKLCVEMNLKVNVVHSEEATKCLYEPNIPIHQLKKFGFFTYLLNMIEAPAPILNYLCKIYGLHRIPVGYNDANNYTDRLPASIRLFYIENFRFSISSSRYSQARSAMRIGISSKKLVCSMVDENVEKQLNMRLSELIRKTDAMKNRRSEIQTIVDQIEEECYKTSLEKAIIEKKWSKVQNYSQRLKYQKQKVESIQKNAVDLRKEDENYKTIATDALQKMITEEINIVNFLKSILKSEEESLFIKEKINIYNHEHSKTQKEFKRLQDEAARTQKLVLYIQSNVQKLKEECEEKENYAKSKCNGINPEHKNFPFKKEFAKLPKDIDELDGLINELQTRINCIGEKNPGVFEEYQERLKLMEVLQNEITQTSKDCENIETKIKTLHEKWYPKIMEMVKLINSNFSTFMATMNFAGEVKLVRKEEFDYDDYGIEILVKYRNNTKLQVLDRYVQSGGERTVAIAVYTLSLQRINNAPFRCVDEINQGMDAKNERKIYDMLVNETCQPNGSQYFFITPKLLPQLSYNESMSVHIVFNGNFVENSTVFL